MRRRTSFEVLDAIRASDDLRMSVEDAAALAFLSPSRFAHLFWQQVGLPFRRYMLWRKLTRGMLAIGREPTRVMMRGDFFEIASPLSTT